jgi:fructose transport system substrate-binding protein
MQFPLKMASLGVEAVAKFAADGTKPEATAGKNFVDTGVTLITDQPQEGIQAEDSTWGKENCWG